MAYLDLTADTVDFGSYRAAPQPLMSLRPSRTALNGAERAAVMLARKDGMASLKAPGIARKILRVAFGNPSPNKLADIRLEALRRFAVAVAHGRARLIEWERAELRLLRFTEAQIDEAVMIAAPFRRTQLSGGWVYALFALVLAAFFAAARTAVGDAGMALLLVTLPALPAWATLAPRHSSGPRGN